MRKNVYRAMMHAEQQKGGPVTYPDVVRSYKQIVSTPLLSPYLIHLVMEDYYRDDMVLADREIDRYSLNPKMQHTNDNPTGYHLFSDRVVHMYPGYVLDEELRIRPGPTTPTVNFNYLKDLLLSKDMSRMQELDWIDENGGTFRFLDSTVNMDGNRIAFASYPRSGNSFLRRFLEMITGVLSGADQTV
jgi:hypothetical protein